MRNRATVKLVLKTAKSNMPQLLQLRVTYQRQPRYFAVPCDVKITAEQFANDRLKITKDVKAAAQPAIEAANEIVEQLGIDFTFGSFYKQYNARIFGDKQDPSLFSTVALDYVNSQQLTGKTRKLYSTAINWAVKYRDTRIINITPDYVEGLMNYIRESHSAEFGTDLSENTLRIYMRTYRAVYNFAIEKEIVNTRNPFSHIKGQPLGSVRREKGALTTTELQAFRDYSPVTSVEKLGQDFFRLSLLLCGINLGDLLRLRNRNIDGTEIHFVRQKTKKTGLVTTLPLTNLARDLLDSYGCVNPDRPDDYILPCLAGATSETMADNRIHAFIRKVNKGIASICARLGLRKITTYTARHTYASFAQSNGMTAEMIQKFLGHTSSRTTEVYLGSLTDSVKEQNRQLLESIAKG